MVAKNFVALKQAEFENNPSYEGRMLIIKQLEDEGFNDEAQELLDSNCPDCLGTGEVGALAWNDDVKQMMDDGTKPCTNEFHDSSDMDDDSDNINDSERGDSAPDLD